MGKLLILAVKRERTLRMFEKRKLARSLSGNERDEWQLFAGREYRNEFRRDSRVFLGRNSCSISINRQHACIYGWGTTEATYSKIGTAAFHEPRRLRCRGSPRASGAEGGWNEGTGDGKSCARARAFNKVLRFFSRGKLVYGSSRMSNGCCGIACRFTHQANFPAYRGAIFLPLPCSSVGSINALLLFHSFPSANSSSRSFLFAPPFFSDERTLSCPDLSSVV